MGAAAAGLPTPAASSAPGVRRLTRPPPPPPAARFVVPGVGGEGTLAPESTPPSPPASPPAAAPTTRRCRRPRCPPRANSADVPPTLNSARDILYNYRDRSDRRTLPARMRLGDLGFLVLHDARRSWSVALQFPDCAAGPTIVHGKIASRRTRIRARRRAVGVGVSRPSLRRPRHGGARSSPAIEGRGRKEGRVREQKAAGPPAASRRGARVRRVRWGAAATRRRRRRRSSRQRRGRRQHLPPLLLRARCEPNRQPISRPSVRAHTSRIFSFASRAPTTPPPLDDRASPGGPFPAQRPAGPAVGAVGSFSQPLAVISTWYLEVAYVEPPPTQYLRTIEQCDFRNYALPQRCLPPASHLSLCAYRASR